MQSPFSEHHTIFYPSNLLLFQKDHPREYRYVGKKFSKLSTRPTNEEPSTGLGLYIVKLLSDKIGAELNVESEVGKGSSFSIRIPFK
jgi:signal transduction histidine kinase